MTPLMSWTGATYFRLGEQAQGEGDFDAAATWYERALGQDRGHEATTFNLAIVRIRRGEPGAALELLEPLIDALGERPEAAAMLHAAHYNRALALFHADRPKEAHAAVNDLVLALLTLRPRGDDERAFYERLEGPAVSLLAVLIVRRPQEEPGVTGPSRTVSKQEILDRISVKGSGTLDTAALLERFARKRHAGDPPTRYNLAGYASHTGARPAAFADLAVASRLPALRAWARTDPMLDRLRSEPEKFERALHRRPPRRNLRELALDWLRRLVAKR